MAGNASFTQSSSTFPQIPSANRSPSQRASFERQLQFPLGDTHHLAPRTLRLYCYLSKGRTGLSCTSHSRSPTPSPRCLPGLTSLCLSLSLLSLIPFQVELLSVKRFMASPLRRSSRTPRKPVSFVPGGDPNDGDFHDGVPKGLLTSPDAKLRGPPGRTPHPSRKRPAAAVDEDADADDNDAPDTGGSMFGFLTNAEVKRISRWKYAGGGENGVCCCVGWRAVSSVHLPTRPPSRSRLIRPLTHASSFSLSPSPSLSLSLFLFVLSLRSPHQNTQPWTTRSTHGGCGSRPSCRPGWRPTRSPSAASASSGRPSPTCAPSVSSERRTSSGPAAWRWSLRCKCCYPTFSNPYEYGCKSLRMYSALPLPKPHYSYAAPSCPK